MYGNTKKDISKDRINYAMISLISEKINVGIIGSGRAGIIKARHFIKEKCNVYMITKDNKYNEDLEKLKENNNFFIFYKAYEDNYILNKHLIIIAVEDNALREKIKIKCDEYAKIYIDCSEFSKGLAIVPIQQNTNNAIIGVNTIGGNPKGSVFLANKIRGDISIYDSYIDFTTRVRNKVLNNEKIKNEVIEFIYSEDFYYFYKKNKGKEIFRLFYSEVNI